MAEATPATARVLRLLGREEASQGLTIRRPVKEERLLDRKMIKVAVKAVAKAVVKVAVRAVAKAEVRVVAKAAVRAVAKAEAGAVDEPDSRS
jgi:hypothetical protein